MANLDPRAVLARLAAAGPRIRAAATAEDVLAVTAEEARALGGATQAWAAALENGAPGKVHSAAGATGAAAEPAHEALTALLEKAHPVARSGELVGAALLGSGGSSEGLLVVACAAGEASDAVLEQALASLAFVAGLALEAARLRARVDAVSRARETLLASVAHDLRNPLNTFAMSAGLLRDDAERNDLDATRALSMISRMERATTRMQVLIDDLVEASRVDARKIDYALRAESAAQLLKDAAAALKVPPNEKGAAVVVAGVDEDVRVIADRARTLQLLAKVVSFAAKCTGDGGSIQLGVSRRDGVVDFTVRALAPGGLPIAAPEPGRGGLALLIARGLADGQRGTLAVEAGDAFLVSFTLPVATA